MAISGRFSGFPRRYRDIALASERGTKGIYEACQEVLDDFRRISETLQRRFGGFRI